MKFKHSMLATAIAAGLTGLAAAGIPVVNISASGSNGGSGVATPTGTAVDGSPNQYRFTGSPVIGTGVYTSYTLYAMDSQAAGRQAFGGLVTVINSSAVTQTFVINISASTDPQGTSALVSGSMSGTLMDQGGNGATFGMGGATPGWSGLLGSTSVASMFTSAGSVVAQPYMTAQIPGQSFGLSSPLTVATGIGSTAGIRLTFQLSAGDRVDLTTAFVVAPVPAPGVFALAAAAGIVGSWRRRRA
jgi:hypothetical protein